MTTELNPPAPDEIEVSVFGPGFGEAIAVHVGGGNWILIDSCQESGADIPASLEYLIRLNVEPRDRVKLVIATHWHDDHVKGLSKIVNTCISAPLACSAATSSSEFRLLAATALPEISNVKRQSSGFREMGNVFKTLTDRSHKTGRAALPRYKHACANQCLFKEQVLVAGDMVDIKVFSLSPSDAAIGQAHAHFAQEAELQRTQYRYIPPVRPNYASVVTWIQVGNHHVLLGGDLEVTNDPDTGWLAVFDSLVIPGCATLFKVAHHGSENGDHSDIWSQLLMSDPIAVLTPYRLGSNFLPRESDLDRLLRRSAHIYITALPAAKKIKWRGAVKDIVDDMTATMTEYYSGWGHVRLRRRIHGTGEWQVALFGDARQLVAAVRR